MSATTDAAIDAANEIPTPRTDDYWAGNGFSQESQAIAAYNFARRLEREVVVLERALRAVKLHACSCFPCDDVINEAIAEVERTRREP